MISPKKEKLGSPPDAPRLALCFLLLYTLAYFPMLLLGAYVWDDLAWHNPATTAELASTGRPLLATLMRAYYNVDNGISHIVFTAPLASFFIHLVAWSCFALGLKSMRFFSVWQIFWITTLSALAPLDLSRALISTALYQWAFLIFTLGFWSYIWGEANKQLATRVLGTCLFIAACLLVESFYAATFGMLLVIAAIHLRGHPALAIREWLRLAGTHAELIAIPVLAFITRMLFFQGSGIYAEYNQISLARLAIGIPTAIISAVTALYASVAAWGVIESPLYGVAMSSWFVGVLLLAGGGTTWYLARLNKLPPKYNCPAGVRITTICLLLLALLIYPYTAVTGGQIVRPLTNWADRNTLTMPLGLGICLYMLVDTAVRPRFRNLVLSGMTLIFIISTNYAYLGLVRDSYLMHGLMLALRANPDARRAHTLIFPAAEPSLWLGRRMQFYEWNQLLNEAFGDQTRLAVSQSPDQSEDEFSRLSFIIRNYQIHPQFGFEDYNPNGPAYIAQWSIPAHSTAAELIRLGWWRITASQKFDQTTKAMVDLRLSSVSNLMAARQH